MIKYKKVIINVQILLKKGIILMKKNYKYFINVSVLFIYILFFWNSYSLANMPHVTYKTANVFLSNTMDYMKYAVGIAYFFIVIVNFVETKKYNKKLNIKKAIMWLIITVLIILGLHYGADYVLYLGRVYTSTPINIDCSPFVSKCIAGIVGVLIVTIEYSIRAEKNNRELNAIKLVMLMIIAIIVVIGLIYAYDTVKEYRIKSYYKRQDKPDNPIYHINDWR